MKICFTGNKRKYMADLCREQTGGNIIKNNGKLTDLNILADFKCRLKEISDDFIITTCGDAESIPYLRDIGFLIFDAHELSSTIPDFGPDDVIIYSENEQTVINSIMESIENIKCPIDECYLIVNSYFLQKYRNEDYDLTELDINIQKLKTHGIKRLNICGELSNYYISMITSILEMHKIDVKKLNESELILKLNRFTAGKGICVDAHFNTFWDHDLKEKMDFETYIMLKPDALIKSKFDKIIDIIDAHGFRISGFLPFTDFVDNAMKLYYLKPKKYEPLIEKHLEMTASIFDDIGMILFLSKNCEYMEQMKETSIIKKEIRDMSFTFGYGGGIGEYCGDATFQLNMAHCPEPIPCNYKKDLDIINSSSKRFIFKKDDAKRYLL